MNKIFEEIINSNEMDINYEKKISTRSSEEMKYDKNKDFIILRDFKQ